MPVIKSVFKNVRSSERKRLINLKTKDAVKGQLKEFNRFVANKQTKEAEAVLPKLYKAIDLAAKKHVISPNSAARKKANAAKKLAVKN